MEYINTPFNYTGNKYALLPQILPLLDYTKPNMVDLFTGGGSVYTNVLDKYETVSVNDIIKELVLIHKNIDTEFVDKVKSLCVDKTDKDGYIALRTSFNEEKTPEKLYALMLCCTNNMMRFNRSFLFNQTFGCRTFNENTQKKIDGFIEHISKYRDKIVYSSKSFDELVIKTNTHYYVDPPYSNTEAGYNAYWKKDDDEKLFNYLCTIDKIGSTFAVSGVISHDGDSCKLLDMLIDKKFNVHYLEHDYNKVSRSKNEKNTQEVLITNY